MGPTRNKHLLGSFVSEVSHAGSTTLLLGLVVLLSATSAAGQNINRIRRVDAVSGVITSIAGNGTAGFAGDKGPAMAATLNLPQGIVVDAFGNIFFVDTFNYRIRRIDGKTGVITTYAGNGIAGDGGDGGPATNVSFSFIWWLAKGTL